MALQVLLVKHGNPPPHHKISRVRQIFLIKSKKPYDRYNENGLNPSILHNVLMEGDIRDMIKERPFPDNRYMGIESEMYVKDARKTYIEYEDLIKRPKVQFSPVSNTTVTWRVGTSHYFKGKESEIVLLVYEFTFFFSNKSVLNPRMIEEELYILFVAVTRAKHTLFIPEKTHGQFYMLRHHLYYNDSTGGGISRSEWKNYQ